MSNDNYVVGRIMREIMKYSYTESKKYDAHSAVYSAVVMCTILLSLFYYWIFEKRLKTVILGTMKNDTHSPSRIGQKPFSMGVDFIEFIREDDNIMRGKRRLKMEA